MGVVEHVFAREPWVDSLQTYVKPYWDHLLQGPWAEGVARGELTLSEMQGWMLQIYPFIHAFPKFLAEALIKVEDDHSRAFFINNIRVEKAHAEHWLWMGEGFGLKRKEMLELADCSRPLLRDVQSLTDWLWYINTKGSLAEAVAGTSFAIEGMAGDIARKITSGFQFYKDEPGVDLSPGPIAGCGSTPPTMTSTPRSRFRSYSDTLLMSACRRALCLPPSAAFNC